MDLFTLIFISVLFCVFAWFIHSGLTQFKDELKEKHEAVDEKLIPFAEKLAKLDETGQMVLRLTTKMDDIEHIFTDKQTRGSFGELELESMVKEQLPPNLYQFQKKLSNGRTPDCILSFPDPVGKLVIDAKFPLDDYRAHINAREKSEQKQTFKKFQAAIRLHIKKIAEDYIIPPETANKALMFVPSEAVFALIHQGDSEIVREGRQKGVFIVSPATLWAVLNTLRGVLRDIELQDHVKQLSDIIVSLGQDAKRLNERAEKLSTHFSQAQEDVRTIKISSEKIEKQSKQLSSPRSIKQLPKSDD